MALLQRRLTILFASVVILALHADAEDWPNWRGLKRDGVSAETRWSNHWSPSGPGLAWKANVGTGFSSCVIANQRLYTIGNRDDIDTVYCLNALSGEIIWKHDYEAPLDDRFFEGGPTSTPTIDQDRVYTLARQGQLFCLDAKTGAVLWSKNIAEETGANVPGWGFSSAPVIHNEGLLLGVGEAGTMVNKLSGEVLWSSGTGEAGYMTPLPLEIDSHSCALIASGRAYQLVDLQQGEVRWKHRWLTTYGCNAADPIVDRQRVFISSGYNRGAALLEMTLEGAKTVWSHREMQNQMNSSVKIGDHLYGFSGNDTEEHAELKCIEFATGKPVWSEPGFVLGSLTAAGERLIVLTGDGELIIAPATPERFEPAARAAVLTGKCWTVPVLANGLLYCRNATGDIVCVDLR